MATKKNLSLKEKYPEIYAQTNIDRTGRERVVPMEVLSLGLGRTGTMSMKAAYEILGYPTYHYVSMMENPPDLDLWLSALRRKYSPHPDEKPFTVAEWNALLGHVSAVTDSPINAFGPELITVYPHAKVVLLIQDYSSSHEKDCQHDALDKATHDGWNTHREPAANEDLNIGDEVMNSAKRPNRTIDYEEGSPESSVEDLMDLVRKEREMWNKVYESLYGSSDVNQTTPNVVRVEGMTQNQYQV
ncbi:hypothetical protein KCU71_g8638, partial [Aureobasidium melanogenum]